MGKGLGFVLKEEEEIEEKFRDRFNLMIDELPLNKEGVDRSWYHLLISDGNSHTNSCKAILISNFVKVNGEQLREDPYWRKHIEEGEGRNTINVCLSEKEIEFKRYGVKKTKKTYDTFDIVVHFQQNKISRMYNENEGGLVDLLDLYYACVYDDLGMNFYQHLKKAKKHLTVADFEPYRMPKKHYKEGKYEELIEEYIKRNEERVYTHKLGDEKEEEEEENDNLNKEEIAEQKVKTTSNSDTENTKLRDETTKDTNSAFEQDILNEKNKTLPKKYFEQEMDKSPDLSFPHKIITFFSFNKQFFFLCSVIIIVFFLCKDNPTKPESILSNNPSISIAVAPFISNTPGEKKVKMERLVFSQLKKYEAKNLIEEGMTLNVKILDSLSEKIISNGNIGEINELLIEKGLDIVIWGNYSKHENQVYGFTQSIISIPLEKELGYFDTYDLKRLSLDSILPQNECSYKIKDITNIDNYNIICSVDKIIESVLVERLIEQKMLRKAFTFLHNGPNYYKSHKQTKILIEIAKTDPRFLVKICEEYDHQLSICENKSDSADIIINRWGLIELISVAIENTNNAQTKKELAVKGLKYSTLKIEKAHNLHINNKNFDFSDDLRHYLWELDLVNSFWKFFIYLKNEDADLEETTDSFVRKVMVYSDFILEELENIKMNNNVLEYSIVVSNFDTLYSGLSLLQAIHNTFAIGNVQNCLTLIDTLIRFSRENKDWKKDFPLYNGDPKKVENIIRHVLKMRDLIRKELIKL